MKKYIKAIIEHLITQSITFFVCFFIFETDAKITILFYLGISLGYLAGLFTKTN